MQARFRERAKLANAADEAWLTAILGRSLLGRARKTFYDYEAEQFVIADLSPTRDELERGNALAQ
jgi:hypothetical protein